ncbi:MAG: InlB B-repeat-containing protein [Bifidobacteriaceae bacterium]|nr:InlB B-repeat-containing protein [Bifidobacteriaceae bacterium]
MERTVKSGDLIGTAGITEPSKNDYVFGGWHTDVNDATSEWRLDKDAVTSDLVLNALWKKVEYDVEFYKDPNDLYIKQKATSGDLITNIVPPTKQDYKFAGWYIDVNDPNSEWRLDKDKVTAKTVLTAKWERIKYTATFNLETGMLYTAVPVDSGDTVTAFANPQKANYDFLGWFIDNNASTEAWRFGTDKVTSDITLTARWKKTEYKVELYSDTNVPYANKSVTTGSVVGVIQEPVKEYFKFDGWYTNELMPRQWDLHTHPVTSDLVLLAHWTRLTYTVTVDPRNGEKVSGGLMPAGLPLNPSENITDPTHNTDKFLGWYYMLGANERIWDMDTSIVVRNVNIYAKWSSASHVVTFESNGGSSVPSEGLNAGDLVTKVQDPTKNHADFAGWYLDRGLTKKWDFDADTVRGDMTLYAAWTPKKYTVTYVFDNGTQDATDTVTAETKIAKQPVTPTKQGYTFAGWYSDAPTFAKGWVFATDTVINDTVLTAKWDSEVFDVSFDSNGGSFVHGQRVKVGEKVATFTDPTLKGYKFAGWFYGANLDTEWDFANDTVTSDILLTAKWERMTRTVKFNTNGGTNIDQQEVTLNEAVADPGTQSKTKAIFLGWFTDPAFTAPWDFASDTVKDDMTLYVKWLEHLKFTFDGPAVSEAKLHSTWTFTKKDACQYSVDGTNYLSFSAKTLKFAPTNTLYFKGDCRDTNGRLDYMFADTFSAYTGNVKVSGGVVPLMDGIAPIETKDYQFRHMFRHDNISEISAEMFYEVYGVPKPELFKNVFYQNKLTSIPDGLFADIGGTPAREAFSGAFGLNPTLEKIGDLGMNITASSSLESVYKDMFKDAGTAASVTKITVPAGGLIEIFTNAPSSFKSLADLYTATRTNGAFSGTGWVNKYADYGSVSSNWR